MIAHLVSPLAETNTAFQRLNIKLVSMGAKCCIVGIASGSAAGKTTLTRTLMHSLEAQSPSLNVEIVSADVFYRTDRTQGPTFVSPSSGEEHFNFNHPDALDLERLLSHLTSRATSPEPPDVLLVEGLLVLHIPQLREMLDVRIFVELEADVRALRRLLRDMKGNRGSTDPQWIVNYYLECARVGHELYVEPSRIHADFIVRGDANFDRIAPLVAAAITSAYDAQNE